MHLIKDTSQFNHVWSRFKIEVNFLLINRIFKINVELNKFKIFPLYFQHYKKKLIECVY